MYATFRSAPALDQISPQNAIVQAMPGKGQRAVALIDSERAVARASPPPATIPRPFAAAHLHRMAREILRIADNGARDVHMTGKGSQIVFREHIDRARLRIETRKWLLSKLLREVYGDTTTVANAPVSIVINMQSGDGGL